MKWQEKAGYKGKRRHRYIIVNSWFLLKGNFMPLIPTTLWAQQFSQFSSHLLINPTINSPSMRLFRETVSEVQADDALPSSSRPVMASWDLTKLVKDYFPLLFNDFLSFLCLEVVSRTSCYITFPGTEVRLISLLYPSSFFLCVLVVGMTFAFLQSSDTSPSHTDWSGITQRGSAITPGSSLSTGGSCSSAIIFLLSWQSLHHFITNSRSECLQTLEAFKGTALLQISVGFEGVHMFFTDSSETTL